MQFVYLDTLDYLYKGGRIGNATRFIGALPTPPSWRCSNKPARSILQWSPTHSLIH
jgi:hypothetical protein